jgi:hypothetical protein
MPGEPAERRLAVLGQALFAFAVLASVVTAGVYGLAVYVFTAAGSGGSDPENPAPVLYPFAVLLLAFGTAATVVCGGAWAGYFAVAN